MNADQLTTFVMGLRSELDYEKRYVEGIVQAMNSNADLTKQHGVTQSLVIGEVKQIIEQVRANDMHVKSSVESSIEAVRNEVHGLREVFHAA